MAQYENSGDAGRPAPEAEGHHLNGWSIGFTFFAAVLVMMIGTFHTIIGLVAVLDDSFFESTPGYAAGLNVTTWGWLQLIGGMAVFAAGGLLASGSAIARLAAIFVLIVSAMGSFASIPYYPLWSMLVICLDIACIWAIAAYESPWGSES
jgi:hypothetical protein